MRSGKITPKAALCQGSLSGIVLVASGALCTAGSPQMLRRKSKDLSAERYPGGSKNVPNGPNLTREPGGEDLIGV
jgi:hypothetical protein